MKTLGILSFAGAMALTSPAFAQSADTPQMQQKPAALSGPNSTTAGPQSMGTTGWSGPHRGPASDTTNAAPTPSDSPDKQPPVGTGADLQGPPKAFPSNKAPE